MKRTVCICVAFIALAFGLYAQTKPAWVSDLGHSDLYGYVSSSYGSSDEWAYEVGVSYKATTEKRARIRAEQDLAARIGAVLGTTIVGNTDFTGISEFIESYGEEMLVRYEEAVNLAVKVKIPNIEHL
ncbi:MAG: hypothetical protein IKP49_01350 [Treponema sp.]|nr:hypothetical protein [Treponema sp.]